MRALFAVILSSGLVSGRVLPSPDPSQVAKTVWVGSVPAAVAQDGTFLAAGIPEGSARLAIETSEGLYVVAGPVTIAPGVTSRVQLAFAGRQDSNAPPPPEKKKPHRGVWGDPLKASLIIVGSAIVLGVAVDQLTQSNSNTTIASPTSPTN